MPPRAAWRLQKDDDDKKQEGEEAAKRQRTLQGALAKKRADKGDEEGLADLITMMGKQLMANTQQIRQITAHLGDTYLIGLSYKPVQDMMQAGTTYFQKVQSIGKGHQLGPPHVHRFAALIEGINKIEPTDGDSKQAILILQQVYKFIDDLPTPEMLDDIVPQCTAKETYERQGKPKMVKVYIGLNPLANLKINTGVEHIGPAAVHHLRIALRCILLAAPEATMPRGPAPKGELERRISRQIGESSRA